MAEWQEARITESTLESKQRAIVLKPKNIEQHIIALITGLRKEGLRVSSRVKYGIVNLPPVVRTMIGENHFQLQTAFAYATVDTPTRREFANGNDDLISSTTTAACSTSYYLVKGTISTSGHRLRLFLHATPQQKEVYRIRLTLPFEIQPSPLFIGDLPSYFTAVGFRHGFTDERVREGFAGAAAYRLPSAVVDAEQRSIVTGKETSEGIDTFVRLYLQEPREERHLDCYEVEIFAGEQKNTPLTKEVVPDSIWQPQENHYCMIGEDGYPFLPVELERVAHLTMHIAHSGRRSTLTDLLGAVPLTFDGGNQWYAAGQLGKGSIELLHMPAWKKNTALVYHETSQRLSYERIAKAAETMVAVRKELSERLAS